MSFGVCLYFLTKVQLLFKIMNVMSKKRKADFCLLGMRTKRPEFKIGNTLPSSISTPHYF